jgi:thiamine pyrophosphokinase
VIVGDFDSLETSVETFYKDEDKKFSVQVQFQHDDDQGCTDFDKAISALKEYERSKYVLSAFHED